MLMRKPQIAWIRHIAWIPICLGLVLSVACGSTSSPASSPAPSKSAAASTSPAPSASAAAKPSASDDWKAEWDKVVAAAKKEGKVVVAGPRGELYRNAAMEFQKAYPEIKLEFTGVDGGPFAPKILAEREGGQFLWDIQQGGSGTMQTELKPKGILDPIKPALILPEVKDASKWLGGDDLAWQDNEKQYIFFLEGRLSFTMYVNRDIVPVSELSTYDQLLDPKWKGKIVSADPRSGSGSSAKSLMYLLAVKGEDYVRKLIAQDLVLMQGRAIVEALARASSPLGLGVNAADIEQFQREGVGKGIQPLNRSEPGGAYMSGGFGNLALINKAPHPNAAKVYINWLLSKEGQTAYVQATGNNSRRLDVEGPADSAPDPKVKYLDINGEGSIPYRNKVVEIAKELIK